ncbi:MAG: RagB/SusD family nutrient uptake outer membrane protein [Chitinophagales bacterium]
MQKRTYFTCIGTMLLMLIFTSCKDLLDLEPPQSLSNETALDNDEGVKQALNGAYDRFSQGSLMGGEVMRNAELFGGEGEIIWDGTYTAPREIWERNILVTNIDVAGFWTAAYECINTCNNVLHAIDVVDPADQDEVQGQALVLRAWCLFELTRMFGQQYISGVDNTQLAVPIITEPTLQLGDNSDVIRNSVEECYAAVIADLIQAETLLPENNGVLVNKHTATGLLARIYLQQGDYTSARDKADAVISSNDFHLESAYADCFNQDNDSDEDIFDVQVSTTDGTNVMNEFFATPANGGRGDILIEESFIDLFDTLDTRKALFYQSGGSWYTGKFNNEYGNLPLMRLAEMILIRAECNERLGTDVGATPLEDYNAIHTRAGLEAAVAVTLDDVLLERRLELAFEGFKVHDVKRQHLMVGTMEFNDPKFIYPIPEGEIEVDPLLVQNPGY